MKNGTKNDTAAPWFYNVIATKQLWELYNFECCIFILINMSCISSSKIAFNPYETMQTSPHRRMIVGVRQGGLSISKTADLLRFSCTSVSRVGAEKGVKNKKKQ